MKRILCGILPAVLVLLQVQAPPVRAQQPAASVEVHLKLSRKLPAAQPLPDPRIAEEDAERAVAEMQGRERRDELIRELTQSRPRRPDLDPDVISGIQSRNLSDALRRR